MTTDISVVGGLVKVTQGSSDPFTDQADNVSWSFNDSTVLSFFTQKTFQIELADLTISGVAPGTKGTAQTALEALFPDANTGNGGSGSVDTSSGKVDGIDMIWESGLTFLGTRGRGRLSGTIYPFNGAEITLPDADADLPRIDLIGIQLNAQGTEFELFSIQGEPSEDPAEPTYDNTSQIRLTIVTLSAGATQPDGVSDIIVYDENLGTGGGEFAYATNAPTGKNANGAATPNAGSKSLTITAWNAADYIQFTAVDPFNISTVDKLIIPIRLNTALNTNRNLVVSLMNGNTVVTNTIQVTTKGLTRTTTGSYQIIVIDVNAFTYTNTNINRVRIAMTGQGGSINMVLDNIRFQIGLPQVVIANQPTIAVIFDGNGNFFRANIPSAAVSMIGAGGITTSWAGNILTIDGSAAGIYSANGTVTSNRTINGGGNTMRFSNFSSWDAIAGSSYIQVDATDKVARLNGEESVTIGCSNGLSGVLNITGKVTDDPINKDDYHVVIDGTNKTWKETPIGQLPVCTKAQRNAISSPTAGRAVYQSDNTPGLRVYNGTHWVKYTETNDD